MLTIKENLRETMKKDGHPDRYVKQYEFLDILVPDLYYMGDYPLIPNTQGYDQFGVLWSFPEGQMGPFPVHDDEHRVLKDITQWREIVHKPFIPDDPGYWGMLNGMAAGVDRTQKYVCALQTQGIFERLHALMGMEDAMCNFYEEPEEMHALIDFLTEIELDFAKAMVERVGIDAVLHHDDWGSVASTFLSPDMFNEFILPAYKKIYGYYKEHNVLIVHHNDGFAATLVPSMIEMGIDIWQGVIPSNDLPALLEKYAGQITFMGEIETRLLDVPDWTPELVREEVERACRKGGPHSFIPCLTAGMPFTAFPGVGDAVNAEIDRMSSILL
ncbi:MAG: uroporphyrinogen decarboxylase family protein [Oscillospiraceae bacterium]|nr:uroporphyrinogen decarboxylase family protein [Oscillospiraceae bacterium]